MIEGTVREMLITLAKLKISLCTIDMAEDMKILEKLQIWEALKAKNLNAKFLIGKALFLIPCIGTENRFSISCLV